MENRKKVCLTLPEKTLKQMEEVRKETGLPIARQIDLALKGYTLCRVKEKRENMRRGKDVREKM